VFCMVFRMKRDFFFSIRSESGPGLRNRIVFSPSLEDQGLKSHRDDRGLWLTTYINLELGSRMNGA
jgi:hypothetical protein